MYKGLFAVTALFIGSTGSALAVDPDSGKALYDEVLI